MVNIKKNVLTQKQAEEEKIGTYHHPTEKTWRSGACVIGQELREGHYRRGYTTKSGKKVDATYINASCSKTSNKGRLIKDRKIVNNNEFRKEILTQKQALKKPLGSYYHPDENTWRSGACPKGEILKKGYTKKSYITKTGKIIPETYVNSTCVKDKGKKGKQIKKIVNIKDNAKILKKNIVVNNKLITNNTAINNTYRNNIVRNNKPPNNTLLSNNTILSNNKVIDNKVRNNKPPNNTLLSNNTILSNNKVIDNKVRNNKPLDNLANKIKNNNNKLLNKLYNNIEQTNIQELTNKMIINLMKKNKL